MRLKKLFLIVMLMLPISVSAQQGNDSYDWTKVIDAIVKVESKGNPKAYNPNGNCAGILQIVPILVKECNQILKEKKSTKRYTVLDRYDVQKSKEMFVLLQEHFNPEHSVEKAIKCWNCGFYTKNWKNKSIGYYRKVMKYYDGGN